MLNADDLTLIENADKPVQNTETEKIRYAKFFERLMKRVRPMSNQPDLGYHGFYEHTKEVGMLGIDYALALGKNPVPVLLAASLHDIARVNDEFDKKHAIEAGPDSKRFLDSLPLPSGMSDAITNAITGHTEGKKANNYIQACLWDADRTHLSWERGYDERFFNTDLGKQRASLTDTPKFLFQDEMKKFEENHNLFQDTSSDFYDQYKGGAVILPPLKEGHVDLWHMTRTDEDLDSFINEGIRSDIGRHPVGGQKGGCYFWVDKRDAMRHAEFLCADRALLVRVSQPQHDVRYSKGWEHDFEISAHIKNEIIEAAKKRFVDRPYMGINFNTNYGGATIFKITEGKTPKGVNALVIHYNRRFEDRDRQMFYSATSFKDERDSGLTQALNDRLYDDDDAYRKMFDRSMYDAFSNGAPRTALKYFGEQKIPVAEVYLVERQKNGTYREKIIYPPEKAAKEAQKNTLSLAAVQRLKKAASL